MPINWEELETGIEKQHNQLFLHFYAIASRGCIMPIPEYYVVRNGRVYHIYGDENEETPSKDSVLEISMACKHLCDYDEEKIVYHEFGFVSFDELRDALKIHDNK